MPRLKNSKIMDAETDQLRLVLNERKSWNEEIDEMNLGYREHTYTVVHKIEIHRCEINERQVCRSDMRGTVDSGDRDFTSVKSSRL